MRLTDCERDDILIVTLFSIKRAELSHGAETKQVGGDGLE